MAGNYIKRMIIRGFKKFESLDVKFNDSLNIIVGDNEAGKSTILDAIEIVLGQTYANSEKAFLVDLFNKSEMDAFKEAPSVESLPSIHIYIELSLDDNGKNTEWFLGTEYPKDFGHGELLYGIKFSCEFDKDMGAGIIDEIAKGHFPSEYYSLKWETFGGKKYIVQRKALEFLSVDTSAQLRLNDFGRFAKNLFYAKTDTADVLHHKVIFREDVKAAVEKLGLPKLNENREFALDDKRVVLENMLSVVEHGIPLESHGSGMASLVKMRLLLDKKADKRLDVLTIEEPENHLSYVGMRKMLKCIENERPGAQVVVATHSNMIVSRLGVKNVLWIDDNDGGLKSLSDIPENTSNYFKRLDNSNLLDFILAKKVVLVEGTTEYLMFPSFYEKILKRSLESDEITVISCGGVSFQRYLQIAKSMDKRVAILTDNDGKKEKISKTNVFNSTYKQVRVFMGSTTEEWTWEKCLYDVNKEFFDSAFKLDDNADYFVHGKDYGRVLGFMLNNKAKVAYKLVDENVDLVVPQYVKDAIEWIGK